MFKSTVLLVIVTLAGGNVNIISSEVVSRHPSKALVQAYLKFGQKSPLTKNATTSYEEAIAKTEELLAWDPPEYIKKNFPYYFAGYSYDNNPVWVGEAGKYDVLKLFAQGSKMVEAIEIALEQGLTRVLQSMIDATVGDEIPKGQVIVDMAGMDIAKLGDPRAIALVFKVAQRYKDAALFGLDTGIIINVNYFVETLLHALRPVLGQLMERVEVYGSNKNTWMPRLHQILPQKSLPPWYGGDPAFKPVAVYG